MRFVCGGLRSTPSSACEIDANVEPLDIRRDRFAALTLERFKRMENDSPCKEMTAKWKQKNRIQKTSFLKKTSEITKEFQFPKNRDVSSPIPTRSPLMQWTIPKISKELPQKADKSTPPNILKSIAYETIDRYPQSSIKAYTDGSAEEATKK